MFILALGTSVLLHQSVASWPYSSATRYIIGGIRHSACCRRARLAYSCLGSCLGATVDEYCFHLLLVDFVDFTLLVAHLFFESSLNVSLLISDFTLGNRNTKIKQTYI